MFSSIFLTESNTILIMMTWCKSRGFKMVLKHLHLICKNCKQSETKWSKIKIKQKSPISREKGQLNWRTLTGGFAVLSDLWIIKLYALDITFSDICNFLSTRSQICKMSCFSSPVKLLLISPKYFFFVWSSQGHCTKNEVSH